MDWFCQFLITKVAPKEVFCMMLHVFTLFIETTLKCYGTNSDLTIQSEQLMFGSSNIYWYILKLYILIFNKRCLLLFFSRWEMLVRVVKGKVMGESWSQWTNSVNVEDHAPIPGIAERVPVIAERVPEKAEAKVMVVNEEDRDHPKDHIDLMSNLVVMLYHHCCLLTALTSSYSTLLIWTVNLLN